MTAIVHNEDTLNGGDSLLSAREIAEFLRVSPYTVTLMVRQSKFQGYKIGKAWRIPKSSFLEYLHERQSERKAVEHKEKKRGDPS